MLGYFCKRILLIIPGVMAVILLIFILMSFLPGTNTARMVRYADDPREQAGSLSLLQQYGKYCYRVFLHQDFGLNDLSGLSLKKDLLHRTGITVRITVISVCVTYLLGVPLGIYAACRRGRWQDSLLTSLTTFFSAIPSFCLALALVIVFAVRLRWFHVIPQDPKDELIPLAVLVVIGAANVAKVTRAGMAEVLEKPFVLALTSLGLSRRSVILRHALKSALVPVFSIFNTICAQLLCGAIVVERFFSMSGLGMTMVRAVSSRATTTLLGCATVVALIMSICSVITDLLFVLVTPSLRRTLSFGSSMRRRGGRGKI
ncbi:MAG: ABC transporter permease [Oscillospiraceae bacterium]|nr:ABC transporter permease [Oscillospiraceae bacterium]